MTTNTEALHIVPINDLREHVASKDCWCKPTEDDKFDDIWIHHAMDGREECEEGEETDMTTITVPRATVEQVLGAMKRGVPTGKITLADWSKALSDLDSAGAQG